jgi:uncharacterized protein (DUF433 family)
MAMRWQDRIVIESDLHHGDPCIKGTRIPVAMIVGSLADGNAFKQILDAYSQIKYDDILTALAYPGKLIQ